MVSAFSLQMLTTISFSRLCSPTIMPSYTSVPGSTNSVPRSSTDSMPYSVDVPVSLGDQHALPPAADLAAAIRRVAVEGVVHHAVAAGDRQKMRAVADQAARRNQKLQPHLAAAACRHVRPSPPCAAPRLSITAPVYSSGTSTMQPFHRLHLDAVHFLDDDFRLGHLQLVPFPAHRFDQNAEMQFPAPGHDKRVGAVRLLHAQADIGLHLLDTAVPAACGTSPICLPGRQTGCC